jgi:diguanylate cyclase (GGDEF)-like protein/PAS domain S-box-containing protein
MRASFAYISYTVTDSSVPRIQAKDREGCHKKRPPMTKRRTSLSHPPRQSGWGALSLEMLLSNLPGAVYRCLNDAHSTMEFASAGIEALTGYPPDAFRPPSKLTYASIIEPHDRVAVAAQIEAAIAEGKPYQVSYRILTSKGATKWIWEQGAAVVDASGAIVALEGFLADYTSVKNADATIREHASMLDKASDAIFVMNLAGTIIFWNKGAEGLFGVAPQQAIGCRYADLFAMPVSGYRKAHHAVMVEGEWRGEMSLALHDDTTVHTAMRWTLVPADADAGTSAKILVISSDISERKNAEARVHRMAYFDPLTDLPNRARFLDTLHHALLGSARNNRVGALMFCDLDNFKSINDTRGHAAGDCLLQAVARRLERSVRATDMVARLGGDEFVVLLPAEDETFLGGARRAEKVASTILELMATPVRLAGDSESITASIGITLFSGSNETVESVLMKADAAMYQAKSAGRKTYRFFDPVMQESMVAQLNLQLSLRSALTDDEFVLYYQPQVGSDGAVLGAEALIRWQCKDGRMILPGDFIHAAEASGQIVEIGHWVLATACKQLAHWSRCAATQHLTLSINISALQFLEADFVTDTEEIFAATGVDPRRVKLELTESLLVTDVVSTAEKMEHLKALGVMFALDDFGTGYSSLSYLRKLPLDQLKIDTTFMRDVLTSRSDASIVRSIIALGDSLGLEVLAEGVESIGQRDFLHDAGCDAYQGFLYRPGLPAEGFMQYATAHLRAPPIGRHAG